jgi:hypothetical protein
VLRKYKHEYTMPTEYSSTTREWVQTWIVVGKPPANEINNAMLNCKRTEIVKQDSFYAKLQS